MDEKAQNSLTVGDILDQLIKPSVVKGPTPSPQLSPKPSVPASNLSSSAPASGDFKLPQLKTDAPKPAQDLSNRSQNVSTSEFRLSLRTMKDDLAKLKQGLKPSGLELDRNLAVIQPKKTAPTPTELPPLAYKKEAPIPVPQSPINLPKISVPPPPKFNMALPDSQLPKAATPFSSPKLPPPPSSPGERPAHIHEEIRIADGDSLPEYLGAPIPKKKKVNPEDEKVEYGVIARVIGSGMTTGILTTVVIAIGLYVLIYYLFINEETAIIGRPTPVPTQIETPVIATELENIFSTTSATTFILPQDDSQLVSQFQQFIELEPLGQQEFKKAIILDSGQKKPPFLELLNKLGIVYPSELAGALKEEYLILLYGQVENSSQSELPGKRVVFIVEVGDGDKASRALRSWESSMANELKDVFDIDPAQQAGSAFLDHERQGIMIRYKNYPLPDKSIDYSIVSSLTGRKYLVLTNSRESMFSPVDKIRGLKLN